MYTLIGQIIVSICLIVFVILQAKGSSGLSGVLGGSTNYHAKRGVEKSLFYATIVTAFLFVGLAIANAI
ncbi:MAG: preprotein translocase subunit SecG [bacterium]